MTPRCPVCGDEQAVELVRLVLPRVASRGVAACPKCRPEHGHAALPVYRFPMRNDTPREGAA